MRKPLAIGLAALALAVTAAPATATTSPGWRVTYVSPETGDDTGLYDVAATGARDAWAVGSRMRAGDGTGTVLRWNGRSWTGVTVGDGTGSFDEVGGSSPDDVWVMGATYDGVRTGWHWDGVSWTAVPLGSYNVADVAVLGPDDAWAVGNQDEGSDVGTSLHWTGAAWQTVAMPFVARRTAAVSGKDVWAVGENATQPLAAHWNGHTWIQRTLPEVSIPAGENGFAYFNDIVAAASDDVWAVGRLYWGGGGELAEQEHNRPVIMHWDGKAWHLTLGAEGDFALSASPDGRGGVWYASFKKNLVHVRADGATTVVPVPVPAPDGRQTPDLRQLAGVPGGTTVLAVGEVAPAPGGDTSWDAVIEQYH